jgi:rhamnose transport system substrate-binding protein
MNKKAIMLGLALLGTVLMVVGGHSDAQAKKYKIALLVKSLGNGFFEAARDGGQEAANELKNVELIYTGPTTATAEGQIELINSLVAQRVSAIAISANDANALVPATKKAMQRGVKVISWDSGIAKEGRLMNLIPSNTELIGRKQIEMISKTLSGKGEIAILSATAQATNQNAWIVAMKKTLEDPQYSGLKLVDVVYGDDQSDKSYREAQGLLTKYPNLKGIIAPTTVGIAAAAKYVVDQKLVGKVFVSGLGLPSEMISYVKAGAVDTFALWNPIDFGYSAVYAAYQFVTRKAKGKPGEKVSIGRMGTTTLDANGEGVMGEPFTFDKSNIDKFAKAF